MRPSATREQAWSAGAGGPGVRRHHAGAAGSGRLAAPPAGSAGGDGGHIGLLEAGVLPAGSRRLRLLATQRQARQERARPAQDRQARRGVAGQGRRTWHVPAQPGPPQTDPPATRYHPLPAQPGPRTVPGEATAGEDPRTRPDQAGHGHLQPARRLRPADAPRDDRPAARPGSASGDGPRPDAPQDPATAPGADRPLRRPPHLPLRRHAAPHRHPPRRTLPPAGPPPRQETRHRRGRQLDAHHHLAPTGRPECPLPRPRSRPPRIEDQQTASATRPRPSARTPHRPQGHPATPTPNPAPLTLRRVLPPAHHAPIFESADGFLIVGTAPDGRCWGTMIGSSIGWGLLVFFGLPILAILALVTVVGIPLGLGVLAALGLIYALGYSASAWIVGRRILREPTAWILAFLVGWGILRVLALVPVLGGPL